jgi:flavin-dependent dehydrogenase
VSPQAVDVLIVGAGPAGLRAAQVLAESGREVLVVERREQIGPKTCAGGLTAKAAAELKALGLPDDLGRVSYPSVSFCGEAPRSLQWLDASVRTVARAHLGAFQATATRAAGAQIVTGVDVHSFDFDARSVRIGDRMVRYGHLIGADGSASRVRRALGLPMARAYFAGEFNIERYVDPTLLVAFDSRHLGSGYSWIFPHRDYTSIGAGGPINLVTPASVRGYLERLMARLGATDRLPRFEAATIEVLFAGFHFRDQVHLVGDAAGVASAVTGEGIYAALVTGEEVARQILDPSFPAPKTRAWLRVKRAHDVIARAWLSRRVRNASFRVLRASLQMRWSQRRVASFFIAA